MTSVGAFVMSTYYSLRSLQLRPMLFDGPLRIVFYLIIETIFME